MIIVGRNLQFKFQLCEKWITFTVSIFWSENFTNIYPHGTWHFYYKNSPLSYLAATDSKFSYRLGRIMVLINGDGILWVLKSMLSKTSVLVGKCGWISWSDVSTKTDRCGLSSVTTILRHLPGYAVKPTEAMGSVSLKMKNNCIFRVKEKRSVMEKKILRPNRIELIFRRHYGFDWIFVLTAGLGS